MIELLRDYFPAILIAVLIGLVVGFLIFRPRQRVRLTDSAPVRPHMTSRTRKSGIASEAAAAACDVSGEIIGAPVHSHLSAGGDAPDQLERIKGVGPRFAEMLHARGFMRFEQIAHLTTEEIDLLDQQLGPFSGRIRRDRIVEQSAYLARGDIDGFEQHFGKL